MFDPGYHVRTLLKRIYNRSEWITIHFDLQQMTPIESIELPPGYHLLDKDSLNLKYADKPVRDMRVTRRLGSVNEIGVGIECGGNLVYDTWIHLGKYTDSNTGIVTDPGTVGCVLLDSYTDPIHRGIGLHSKGIAECLRIAVNMDLKNMGSLVYKPNVPALRSQKNNGARATKRTVLINFCGFKFQFHSKTDWQELELDLIR